MKFCRKYEYFTPYEKALIFEKQRLGTFSVVDHIFGQAGILRLYRLSRLISARRIRFIVDYVWQQNDYYYDSMEEEYSMKVPINQKYMLTITEAAKYFGKVRRLIRTE